MPDVAAGYTVREVARRYRVGVARVLGWIRRRELRAIDRRDASSARPSYVVTAEALAEFERGRCGASAPPKAPRRRKKTEEVDYFPDL